MDLLITILIAVTLVVAWIFFRQRSDTGGRSTAGSAPASPVDGMPKIRGNGRFSVEVVGESFHRDNLRAMYPIRHEEDGDEECNAVAELRLEDSNPHDSHAVAVYLHDRKVGYLSRKMAREFREAISRDHLNQWQRFLVDAIVWVPDDPETNHSVRLDLPEK